MTDRIRAKAAAEPQSIPFRIHFEDGRTEDVTASSADEARATHKTFGTISKIKIIRESKP